jgi:hypothetical protein
MFYNYLFFSSIIFIAFGIGYGLGRRKGRKEGLTEGLLMAPLDIRRDFLLEGQCRICGSEVSAGIPLKSHIFSNPVIEGSSGVECGQECHTDICKDSLPHGGSS